MPTIPQGMECTMDIVPYVIRMKYEDHDLLESPNIIVDPFIPKTRVDIVPTARTLHDWEMGLEK